jgi:hypothetical protein
MGQTIINCKNVHLRKIGKIRGQDPGHVQNHMRQWANIKYFELALEKCVKYGTLFNY